MCSMTTYTQLQLVLTPPDSTPDLSIWCLYSGTPLNGHPSKADIHDITDNSKSPDCPPIHFNT